MPETIAAFLIPLLAAAETAQARLPVEAMPTTFDIVFPLTVLVLIGVTIPGGMLLANHVISRWVHGTRNTSPGKVQQVEGGLNAVVGTANERFSVKFYLIAMLFLVFDLEVAFLYPWAIQVSRSQGWGMIWLLLIFLLILEVAYLYLYKKGALDWDK